jgi:D-hydroxyproline dehydrogenase subunit beta
VSHPPLAAQFDLAALGARILGLASALAASAALQERLGREQPAPGQRASLSLAQNADDTLVVGDSHHYAVTPDPFVAEEMHPMPIHRISRSWSVSRSRARAWPS